MQYLTIDTHVYICYLWTHTLQSFLSLQFVNLCLCILGSSVIIFVTFFPLSFPYGVQDGRCVYLLMSSSQWSYEMSSGSSEFKVQDTHLASVNFVWPAQFLCVHNVWLKDFMFMAVQTQFWFVGAKPVSFWGQPPATFKPGSFSKSQAFAIHRGTYSTHHDGLFPHRYTLYYAEIDADGLLIARCSKWKDLHYFTFFPPITSYLEILQSLQHWSDKKWKHASWSR